MLCAAYSEAIRWEHDEHMSISKSQHNDDCEFPQKRSECIYRPYWNMNTRTSSNKFNNSYSTCVLYSKINVGFTTALAYSSCKTIEPHQYIFILLYKKYIWQVSHSCSCFICKLFIFKLDIKIRWRNCKDEGGCLIYVISTMVVSNIFS